MRSYLPALALLAAGLIAGCSAEPEANTPAAATPSATVAWNGPSGLEAESEQAARATLEAQRLEAERVEAERVAAEAATKAAAEAAAQRAAEDAAAQDVIDAEGGCPPGWYFDDILGCTKQEEAGGADDGYVSSDLEVRCSEGTATVEECFGPGSDLNDNGVADINE
jgi:membrane protein involved in colicin uptake